MPTGLFYCARFLCLAGIVLSRSTHPEARIVAPKSSLFNFREFGKTALCRPAQTPDPGVFFLSGYGTKTSCFVPLPADTAVNLSDLPLTITNATGNNFSNTMAVFISGDGGWTDFDQKICNGLASKGMPVAGLNALKYFWKARTPEGASWDLSRILQTCEQTWNKQEVILAGYSWGAEVMPFLFNRLSDEQKKRIKAIVLLSPGARTAFEYHVTFLLNQNGGDAKQVAPELEKMYDYRTLFIYGSEEDTAWLKPLLKGNFQIKTVKGAHHYNGNTGLISETIGAFLK